MSEQKKLYVMISSTNTKMGSFIRFFTRYEYNHVSLSIDDDLKSFVSFGRMVNDAPLYGGFINETIERYLHNGKNSMVRIFCLDIDNEKYNALSELFKHADNPDSGLIYNYLDALATPLGLHVKVKGAYTCLGFANAVLGTNCKSIKALNKELSDKLIFEGEISELGYDSGDRTALYFKSIGFRRGIAKTTKRFIIIAKRIVHEDTEDKIESTLK